MANHARTAILLPLAAVLPVLPAGRSGVVPPGVRADTSLSVVALSFDTARLGENPLRATVRNRSDSAVLAVMDLRAVPGLWLLPNMQARFSVQLAPGEQKVLEGRYQFRRLSREGTLRVEVGPGHPIQHGLFAFDRVDYRRTFPVGETSPDAFDPARDFTETRRGPLEIYAWKGSLAAGRVDSIAAARLQALRDIAALVGVEPPARVRLVFYPDEATKLRQTGHQGVGWAFGHTLVEVYNDSVRLDSYHELTHIVAAPAGSPPPALGEGLAVYVTERLGGDALAFLGASGKSVDQVACALEGTPRFIPLAELLALDNVGSSAERAPAEYAEAGSFVKYLVEARGLDRFRAAYRTVDADSSAAWNRGRLVERYGMSLDAMQGAWLARVRGDCAAGRPASAEP